MKSRTIKTETLEEFLAKGGKITKVQLGAAEYPRLSKNAFGTPPKTERKKK